MLKFYRQGSVAYSSPSEKFVNETNSQVGNNAFISLKRKKLTAGNSRRGTFGLIRQEGNCGKAEDESGYLERFHFEAKRRSRECRVGQSFPQARDTGIAYRRGRPRRRPGQRQLPLVNSRSRAPQVRQTCLLRTTIRCVRSVGSSICA